ncbi:efflux RND transporter permease subunit [Chamaesiphon minutus]|uniref:Cation/multidrug efflux pump n=1 Tax=Chamaesiphon minutus (strain ATCC 27169 / PCC 6605) TaxID=1173020 RepID=K9UL14_CHAP6|nr:efflux RND transporter permease subunit [Chamaesiphon minutus]AFY94879.1 cation/multidrug efflux pump [Chamaesiphon minutus PCC 6605]
MQNPPAPTFSLSTLSIRQYIGTLMLTLTVIIVGIYFTTQLPVDLLPSITYPRIGVRLQSPGISPEVAIDEITRPLEEALATTDGVVQIYSQTREGQVNLDLYFNPGSNIDQALNDTTAAFNRNRNQLPDSIEEPRLFKIDPSQLPVYELALTAPSLKDVDLRIFADEELSRELSIVDGVASADVSGGVQEEVRVDIDLNRLQSLGISLPTVLEQLTQRNQDVSGGRIRGDSSEPLTRAVGRFQNASEIRDLAFATGGQSAASNTTPSATTTATTTQTTPTQQVYLRDFATVTDGTEEERVLVNLNRQKAVKISVQKQSDANTVSVVDAVKAKIAQLRTSGVIPADMVITPTLDESVFIRNSLADVIISGLSGALLAAISVFIFLGSLRQTFIIALTIPLCTLAAAIVMKLSGFSLNIFSLGGLAISVGQAIDTSVVILENVSKRIETLKLDREKNGSNSDYAREAIAAVEDSSQEVESSLVASTAANLVSVLPFVLVGGFISLLFNELILTICFAVAASLIVALTVVPMLSARLFSIERTSGLNRLWFLRAFDRRLEGGTRIYGNVLAKAIRRPAILVVTAFVLLGGSGFLMAGQIPQEILPRISTGQANVNVQFPSGTSLATNRRVMAAVDDVLLKQPETQYVFTTAGGSLFGNTVSSNPSRSTGSVTLKPGSDIQDFTERTTRELNRLNLAGIRVRVSAGSVRGLILNNSPVRGAEVDVVLQGQNAEVLTRAGRQVLAALDDRVKLSAFRPDADDRQPEVQIRPNWERANALGLTTQSIGSTIQTAIEGSVPTQLQRNERLVDVRVQLNQSLLKQPSQLAQIPLFVNNNSLVRLSDVATISEGQAPGEIQRINQRPVFIIAGNLNKGASLGAAIAEVQQIVSTLDLPDGVTLLPSYAGQTNQELQSALVSLGGLAAFLVFVVMAVQYNSIIDPLVIILTVPLALVGGLLGLYITQTAIGITVVVGAVLLVGIVVNNAIIMVETANQIREEEGLDRHNAILKAAPQRLRPILMTTVTTVLGLFPLALGIGEGSEFLQPLGIVVFSGLTLATLLTLFIIPCFYVLLHDIFKWGMGIGSRDRKHPLLTSDRHS